MSEPLADIFEYPEIFADPDIGAFDKPDEEGFLQDFLLQLGICDHGANLRVQSWQQSLEPGDYYVFMDGFSGVIHYGLVLPFKHRSFRDAKFLRRVRTFCEQEPSGILGIFHVSWATGVLNREQFERAKDQQWPSELRQFARIVAGDPMWDMLPA